jgi:hypothetical protein
MRKRKTTIVTFESRERVTIRPEPSRLLAWCERCDAEVLLVTPNEAATRARTDARAIFRGVESGELHFFEDENGVPLICSNSLERASGSRG